MGLTVSFYPMQKYILLLLITALSFLITEASNAEDKLIPGTDKPEILDCGESDKAYIYDDYVVFTQASGDFDGSNIYIFSPSKNDPCKLNPRNASYFVGVGEYGGINKFIGKHEDLIFIDQWTGRNFKRLLAINIPNKSLVFLDTYAEPRIEGDKLIYFRTLKAKRKSVRDKIPCPKAQEWQDQGKEVLYVEKMYANLDNMKKVPTKEFSCIPSEPIANIKPSGYGH